MAEVEWDKPADEEVRPPYIHCQPFVPGLRIGDRVQITVGDAFIDEGQEGIVTNVMPPRPSGWPKGAARVMFDNQTIAVVSADRFRVLPREVAA